MAIYIDREIMRKYKEGYMTKEDLADYLLKTFPAKDIALSLVNTLDYDYKPIAISLEDFNNHFRIKGTKLDGSPESRGRKPKDYTP